MGLLATVPAPGTSENVLSAIPRRENPCCVLLTLFTRFGFRMETYRAAPNEPHGWLQCWLPGKEGGASPKSWLNSRPRFHRQRRRMAPGIRRKRG